MLFKEVIEFFENQNQDLYIPRGLNIVITVDSKIIFNLDYDVKISKIRKGLQYIYAENNHISTYKCMYRKTTHGEIFEITEDFLQELCFECNWKPKYIDMIHNLQNYALLTWYEDILNVDLIIDSDAVELNTWRCNVIKHELYRRLSSSGFIDVKYADKLLEMI